MSHTQNLDGCDCYQGPEKYRNGDRKTTRRHRNDLIHEPPVRDKPKKDDNNGPYDFDDLTYCGKFEPPEPPMGDYDAWELQFGKWWGWNWIRKDQKTGCRCPDYYGKQEKPRHVSDIMRGQSSRQPSRENVANGETNTTRPKKKKRRKCTLFDCFKKEPPALSPRETNSERIPSRTVQVHQNSSASNRRHGQTECLCENGDMVDSSSSSECCCCCNALPECCCCCTQVCCPCMRTTCCQCTEGTRTKSERRNSKTTETQTRKAMKEQETKMSLYDIPKQDNATQCECKSKKTKKKCRCKMKVCCPCRRPICCCPCPQNTCCPCVNKNKSSPNKQDKTENLKLKDDKQDKLINFCLTRNNTPGFLKDLSLYNKTNLSFLRPIDLLLRNNSNIKKLFGEPGFKQVGDKTASFLPNFKMAENKTSNFLDAKETVSFLSISESLKKKDQEHCKLLSAVCEAILSNHKFEQEAMNPLDNILKPISSKSTNNSTDSFNSSLNRGLFQNFLVTRPQYNLNKKIRSNGEMSIQTEINNRSEIGIQASEIPNKKAETFSQTRDSSHKPVLTKNHFGSNFCLENRGQKRGLLMTEHVHEPLLKTDDTKKPKIVNNSSQHKKLLNDTNSVSRKSKIPLKIDRKSNHRASGAILCGRKPSRTRGNFETIERLLTTIDLSLSSDTNEDKPEGSKTPYLDKLLQNNELTNKKKCEALFQREATAAQNFTLLENTSPPFTDSELPFSLEESVKEARKKNRTQHR